MCLLIYIWNWNAWCAFLSCICILTLGAFNCLKMVAYLSTRRVASAGPCGGSLCRTVWALGWQPTTAVSVAEALAVLFAYLHGQTAKRLYVYDLAKIFKQAAFVLNKVYLYSGVFHLEGKMTFFEHKNKLTFFWRRQWKMKINIPWKVLNIVKRYAMTIEASLMKKRPKDHVRPNRHSKAKAPMTQDLKGGIKQTNNTHTHTHKKMTKQH